MASQSFDESEYKREIRMYVNIKKGMEKILAPSSEYRENGECRSAIHIVRHILKEHALTSSNLDAKKINTNSIQRIIDGLIASGDRQNVSEVKMWIKLLGKDIGEIRLIMISAVGDKKMKKYFPYYNTLRTLDIIMNEKLCENVDT